MRIAREGRQSKGQVYSELDSGSKAERNLAKFDFERALRRANVHNAESDEECSKDGRN